MAPAVKQQNLQDTKVNIWFYFLPATKRSIPYLRNFGVGSRLWAQTRLRSQFVKCIEA